MERSYQQGKYKPKNPSKYNGDCTSIVYRSSYELKMFQYCDLNENVISWGSEEFCVPYRSQVDGKVHRYFPDFLIKIKEQSGEIKTYVIEVKPKKQTMEPKVPKRKTKSWIYEMKTYAVNQAKWKAADEWCKDRRIEFKVITEDNLFN